MQPESTAAPGGRYAGAMQTPQVPSTFFIYSRWLTARDLIEKMAAEIEEHAPKVADWRDVPHCAPIVAIYDAWRDLTSQKDQFTMPMDVHYARADRGGPPLPELLSDFARLFYFLERSERLHRAFHREIDELNKERAQGARWLTFPDAPHALPDPTPAA